MRMMIKDMLTKTVTVCGEAENGWLQLKAIILKPDLVMMDITMPEMDGIEAVKNKSE